MYQERNDTYRLQEFYDGLQFDVDDRRSPDNLRRGQFRRGWREAESKGPCGPATLKRLTWSNLGRRAGVTYGPADDATIDEAFDALAQMYVQGRPR